MPVLPMYDNTDQSVFYGRHNMTDDLKTAEATTKDRILDAALTIFSNQGYHETRLDEVVNEAKVSKGSIYFHFPNKEQLFLALVDQFADKLERSVAEATHGETVNMRRVQLALDAILATFSKYRRPAKILLVQAVGLGASFERKRLEVNQRFAEYIRVQLDEAIRMGEIAPIDTVMVAHAWMGAIYNVVIQWLYTNEPRKEQIVVGLLPILLNSVGYKEDQHA